MQSMAKRLSISPVVEAPQMKKIAAIRQIAHLRGLTPI
jgi:hypothetical protein